MFKPHHSDASEAAMHEADAHNVAAQQHGVTSDAVPPAEHGTHAYSPAAHLDSAHTKPDTRPQGNLRQGSDPGARREPPMVIQRAGKQHRD